MAKQRVSKPRAHERKREGHRRRRRAAPGDEGKRKRIREIIRRNRPALDEFGRQPTGGDSMRRGTDSRGRTSILLSPGERRALQEYTAVRRLYSEFKVIRDAVEQGPPTVRGQSLRKRGDLTGTPMMRRRVGGGR